MIDKISYDTVTSWLLGWSKSNVMTSENFFHFSISISLFVTAYFLAKIMTSKVKRIIDSTPIKKWYMPSLIRLKNRAYPICGTILFSIYTWISSLSGVSFKIPYTITSLFIAWLLISIITSMLGRGYLMLWIKYAILAIITLKIFGIFEQTIQHLDAVSIILGSSRISIYSVLKGITIFIALIWTTIAISNLIDKHIVSSKDISPSLKELIKKSVITSLYFISILIGLTAVGFDLTLFAVFSGALGVGIGIGLQKVVSNFISGIVLLSDRSIKPGDVIVINDTYGWVNSLGARYVSVVTRDGKEHLIPNEDLITKTVENWSFSNEQVRLKLPISISYNADLKQAIKFIEDSAGNLDRILSNPPPKCLIRSFGDNGIDLELRFWITDPINGVRNIQSDVLLRIWEIFQENNIEIPFPQRDIYVKSVPDTMKAF